VTTPIEIYVRRVRANIFERELGLGGAITLLWSSQSRSVSSPHQSTSRKTTRSRGHKNLRRFYNFSRLKLYDAKGLPFALAPLWRPGSAGQS